MRDLALESRNARRERRHYKRGGARGFPEVVVRGVDQQRRGHEKGTVGTIRDGLME